MIALFDLDGVIFDTEPLYSEFWKKECRRYKSEIPDLYLQIKGQTLERILSNYLSEFVDDQKNLVARLNTYEREMLFEYVPGFERFVQTIRKLGMQTSVVTSSNQAKMEHVYRQHPKFRDYFDKVFTSEDFSESKPSPECYLTAMDYFGVKATDCVVFEDSFNGLIAGKAAGMKVVGVATSNSPELIKPYSDVVISNFINLVPEKFLDI